MRLLYKLYELYLEGILVFNVTRHWEASTPLEGNYTLSFGSHTTVPIPHSASPMEVSYY